MQNKLSHKKKRLIDLHIHSHFSDGRLTIPEIVDLYGRKGFAAIAMTDHLADQHSLTGFVARHLSLSLSEKKMTLYLETIQREAKRAWQQYNMLLIPGVEITMNAWSKNKGAHFLLQLTLSGMRPTNSKHVTCGITEANF